MGQFTQSSSVRTYQRGAVRFLADGSMQIAVIIRDADNKVLERIEVIVPMSGQIIDDRGRVIAATVPANLNSDRTSILARIDTAIDNAAAAGKFNR